MLPTSSNCFQQERSQEDRKSIQIARVASSSCSESRCDIRGEPLTIDNEARALLRALTVAAPRRTALLDPCY